MTELSSILSDPDLGGTTFFVSRKTWRRELGEVVPESASGQYASGSIQPAASEDLNLVPQEERSQEMIIILSTFHFRLGEKSDTSFTTADIVIWKGNKYRVVRVKSWAHPAGYYKAWAIRQR